MPRPRVYMLQPEKEAKASPYSIQPLNTTMRECMHACMTLRCSDTIIIIIIIMIIII